MTNYYNKPFKLNHSERFLVSRCLDPRGNPVEFGVTVSYTAQALPSFDVEHQVNANDFDTFYTTDAQEALLVYNSIVQGEQ